MHRWAHLYLIEQSCAGADVRCGIGSEDAHGGVVDSFGFDDCFSVHDVSEYGSDKAAKVLSSDVVQQLGPLEFANRAEIVASDRF